MAASVEHTGLDGFGDCPGRLFGDRPEGDSATPSVGRRRQAAVSGTGDWRRRRSQWRTVVMMAITAMTAMKSKIAPAMIVATASPVSATRWAEPQPSHTGARAVNGSPSGARPGQVTRMPLPPVTRVALVTVEQPLRPHSWPYELGKKVAVLPAPAR